MSDEEWTIDEVIIIGHGDQAYHYVQDTKLNYSNERWEMAITTAFSNHHQAQETKLDYSDDLWEMSITTTFCDHSPSVGDES